MLGLSNDQLLRATVFIGQFKGIEAVKVTFALHRGIEYARFGTLNERTLTSWVLHVHELLREEQGFSLRECSVAHGYLLLRTESWWSSGIWPLLCRIKSRIEYWGATKDSQRQWDVFVEGWNKVPEVVVIGGLAFAALRRLLFHLEWKWTLEVKIAILREIAKHVTVLRIVFEEVKERGLRYYHHEIGAFSLEVFVFLWVDH